MRRTDGNCLKNSANTSSAFASVASSGGILPRLLQISVLSRACKCLTRMRVVSARSSELTSASLRKPGNIRLISSVQAASMDRGEGSDGGEVIYPAGLAISLKQFLNCIPRRRGHQTNYAPAEREKK